MSQNVQTDLLFNSVDTATFYYQRCTMPLPEVGVPKNTNCINYFAISLDFKYLMILGVVSNNVNILVVRFLFTRFISDDHFSGVILKLESAEYGSQSD